MIEVDDSRVLRMFNEFNTTNRKRALRSGIRQALNIVKKKSILNLAGAVNNINKKDKYGQSLRRGIKVSVAKDTESGKIHIMGNFKLKFFEMGTKERFIKSYRSKTYSSGNRPKRGSITASHFFTNAVNSEEYKVYNSLNTLIRKSIQKVNNKYR